ncbi:SusD family protein [Niastella yeongjuensis]|nr:SusD family protein [Niastella yeongjuensis]
MKRFYNCNNRLFIAVGFIFLYTCQTSCKKFIQVEAPGNSTNAENVYKDDAIAASVLTGIYATLSRGNTDGSFEGAGDFTSLSLFPSLSADELTLFDLNKQTYFLYYSNSLSANPGNIGLPSYWNIIYPYIFVANSAIDGLNTSTTLTPRVKQQLLGEAKFIRAFCYFYLVNLYGDVPLSLTDDWKVNSSMPRTSASQIYDQIISDLKEAQELLSTDYLSSDASSVTSARVRPNKWVAAALLARTYLYINDFSNAEIEASKIIDNGSYQLVSLNNVFLKDSKEAIWQLQAVGTGTNSNTGEGKLFVLPSTGPTVNQPVYLSDYIVNTFEAGDLRKINWIAKAGTTSYCYPAKYKIGAINTTAKENCTVFRLSEQYLIRAEARARQNKLPGAIADLDSVRKRANISLMATTNPGIDQTALIDKIIHERQVELFTEWGHRWFDLKRTNIINTIMPSITIVKNGTWEKTDQLYPIPQSEINKAPQIIQNSGYE